MPTRGDSSQEPPAEDGERAQAPGDGTRDPAHGVYGITTAAELVGMQAQNLRVYERRGLVEPDRTRGGTRRYSENDLTRLRRIGELLDEGLNLAGISRVLDLEEENADLRAGNDQLRADLGRR